MSISNSACMNGVTNCRALFAEFTVLLLLLFCAKKHDVSRSSIAIPKQIEKMEKLLQESGHNLLNREFCQKITQSFK